jgi:hypothetical protein
VETEDVEKQMEGEEAEEEGGEQVRVKLPRTPSTPTAIEIQEHLLTGHAVYRSWCPHCVRGKGVKDHHPAAVPGGESDVPTISLDYGYLGAEGGGQQGDEEAEADGQSPFIVVQDGKSKSIFAHLIPQKGVHYEGADLVISQLMKDLDWTGYHRIRIKSDNEPAMVAFVAQLKTAWNHDMVVETTPEGESDANGAAERAVGLIKSQVRTLYDYLQAKLEKEIPGDHPLISWMVQFAASVRRNFTIGHDGKTASHRIRGRPAKAFSRIWRADLVDASEPAAYGNSGDWGKI